MPISIAFLLLLLLSIAASASAAPPPPPPRPAPSLDRATFNRLAAVAGAPLFWRADADHDGTLDPDELVVHGTETQRERYVRAGAFTSELRALLDTLVEMRRREAVRDELAQGRPTLVETDFTTASAQDRAVIRHLVAAARAIDELYLVQTGAAPLRTRIPRDDVQSRALFDRNRGPWCEAPRTVRDPFCNAVPDFPEQRIDGLPPEAPQDDALCARLAAAPNARDLTSPFTVVRAHRDALRAVPYHVHYATHVRRIAASLRAAAAAVKSPDEAAFKTYLTAAAGAFETDDWERADEAWAAMSGENSRWYVRVAADETYFGACQLKAGYHMSLARIDPSALEWQRRLTALRGDMEVAIAATIGPPYAARDVAFKLPDFINVVLNAGDSRGGLGATIGQALPNFGKVAEESRGRTVVMVNLYTDPDSIATQRAHATSILTPETARFWTDDPKMARLDTVLHEAAHNLGPTGTWRVDGKLPEDVFGGATDAILEELKAQVGSLYYMELLRRRALLADDEARQGNVATFVWACGHVARGMRSASGKPQTYSQLSAILIGELMTAGAVRFDETAGGSVDPGRFAIDFDALPAAVEALMKTAGGLKARGDRATAEALIARHVDDAGLARIRAPVIIERFTRHPRATFVYAVHH